MHDALRSRLEAALDGSYRIERELGGGGMSVVFLAVEAALERRVAIKVLSPQLTASVDAERFRREILLSAKLQHPHIVPVLRAGEAEGTPYFVMPYVEGESLRTRLARTGAMPLGEAVRILRGIAAALAYAHARGVVHRDIKPDNVMLSAGGIATVTDFGVARALAAASRHAAPNLSAVTQAGLAVGTPAYMPPEQAAADPSADHRVDLYAFGIVAYEVLTGATPFADLAGAALMTAHATAKVPRITQRRADVPPSLAGAVMHCLAKRPEDRPAGADHLVAILDALIVPGGEVARRVPEPSRQQRSWPAIVLPLLVIGALLFASGLAIGHPRGWRAVVPFASASVPGDARTRAVLTRFDAAPGDSILALVFAEAVRGELNREPRYSVIAPPVVERARQRLRLEAGSGLPAAVAREVAVREGAALVVDGQVARVGDEHTLSLQVLEAETGQLVTGFREVARGAEEVLLGMDRLSKRLIQELERTRLAVRAPPALPAVTTRSTEALRQYARGMHELAADTLADGGISLFADAIGRDSLFVMAHLMAADVLSRRDAPLAAWRHLDRAATISESTGGRERLLVQAAHAGDAGGMDADSAMAVLRAALAEDPSDAEAHRLMATLLRRQGRAAEAPPHLERALQSEAGRTRGPLHAALVSAWSEAGDDARAGTALTAARSSASGSLSVAEAAAAMALMTGDPADAAAPLAALLRSRDPAMSSLVMGRYATALAAAGRMEEARDSLLAQRARDRQQGRHAAASARALELAWIELGVGADRERALLLLDELLASPGLTPDVAFGAARLANRAGSPSHADAALRHAGALPPPAERLLRAEEAVGVGNGAAALAALGGMHELEGACHAALRARAHDLAGDHVAALTAYERAWRTAPLRCLRVAGADPAALRVRAGELAEAAGNGAAARAHFQGALRLWSAPGATVQPRVAALQRRLAGA